MGGIASRDARRERTDFLIERLTRKRLRGGRGAVRTVMVGEHLEQLFDGRPSQAFDLLVLRRILGRRRIGGTAAAACGAEHEGVDRAERYECLSHRCSL